MDEDGTNLSWRNVVACHKNNPNDVDPVQILKSRWRN